MKAEPVTPTAPQSSGPATQVKTEMVDQRLIAAGRKEVEAQAVNWNSQKWQLWPDSTFRQWGQRSQHMQIDLESDDELDQKSDSDVRVEES